MKWLGYCLAARVFNFNILVEPPKISCSFELRHFINPERYASLSKLPIEW